MSRQFRIIAMLFIAGMTFVCAALGQSTGQEAAIRKVLQSQVEAWNRGDLDGFMAGYWNSPALTYFSGARETEGWQPTLERYRKKYQAPG
jgi:hypothetical protein